MQTILITTRCRRILDFRGRLQANFYEKARFVKVDVATALWLTQLLRPSRYASIRTSVSQLSSDSVHYGIRLFEPETLQSSDRLP
jgi:hypothetical protein